MKPASASPETLAREELAIKFVNTVAWRLRNPIEDRVASPQAMLKWMLDAELVERTAFEGLSTRWKASTQDALSFLQEAVALREAIYRLYLARMRGKQADIKDVTILNEQLAEPLRGMGLAPRQGTLKWQSERGTAGGSLLKPIAWSAASLLTGPRAGRVKQCQDERGCGWVFIDESRAQNRRWCSMGDCGNLAKSRRHLHQTAVKAAKLEATSRSRRS
jgi:predicted RNA-binding Zn ribbon-like protein